MSKKRFTDTQIWGDDWFYELSVEYKLFWFYVKDDCSYAGIWKPKVRVFKAMTDVEIDLTKAINYFNMGKQRIRELDNGDWFIEDFFKFQYGESMNLSNRVHMAVCKEYQQHDIPISSVRGVVNVVVDKKNVSPEDFDLNVGVNLGSS
jgi:hypothetical protein